MCRIIWIFGVKCCPKHYLLVAETSSEGAVEQILQQCGNCIWKFTFLAAFHAPGLRDQHICLQGSWTRTCHLYFSFLTKKREPKTTHPHPACEDDSVLEWLPEKKPQSQEITLIEWKLRNDRRCSLSPGYKQYFHALPIILFASILVYFY